MSDSKDSTGKLALAILSGALVAGPLLGIWPLVGVIVAYGSVICIAKLFSARR
jgi:hypothetical protein